LVGDLSAIVNLSIDVSTTDGGGIRGFSQLFILEELASRIMHDLGLQESPTLCDYFDVIGGVGTGG
jgi:patatin-like phospholipase/acyl hydrolase